MSNDAAKLLNLTQNERVIVQQTSNPSSVKISRTSTDINASEKDTVSATEKNRSTTVEVLKSQGKDGASGSTSKQVTSSGAPYGAVNGGASGSKGKQLSSPGVPGES